MAFQSCSVGHLHRLEVPLLFRHLGIRQCTNKLPRFFLKMTKNSPANLLITGASGRTGSLALKKAATFPHLFSPRGLARSKEKIRTLFDESYTFSFGSILDEEVLRKALDNCQKLLILTSAVPIMTRNPDGTPKQPPEFVFKEGEEPEQIDWLGQKKQIDIAKECGVDHIVLVSSMGVTQADHPLNRLGNILTWKKKSEDYLRSCGIAFTIIHPGGLIDDAGGRRFLLVGHNDELLNSEHRTIPREDVADIALQSFLYEDAKYKSFDVVSAPCEKNEDLVRDWKSFFSNT
ncbi:hypothetical protein GpartN1_g4654.t1 [Galdieria partita]|uniref:NAD(P)-binding domain-containing protein n=1 Tax=Galdieria partita TaxID=83374 RepID=A0A9C7URF1_9RHOD|nr:hypothetical protein GpartN1_g4654.t1 [Galdieria partita]